MPDRSLPFTIPLGNLPPAPRLGLRRLLRTQPNPRVVRAGAGTAALLAPARRLRPGLVMVGERTPRDVEPLSRYQGKVITPADMLREAARWGVFDCLTPDPSCLNRTAAVLRKVRPACLFERSAPVRRAAQPSSARAFQL